METHFCSPRGYCLSSWCDGGGVRGCQRGARLWTYVLRAQKASSCAALHCQPQTGPQLPRQPASAWARPLSSACVAAVSTCSPQSQQLISHSQRSCYMQQLKLHPALLAVENVPCRLRGTLQTCAGQPPIAGSKLSAIAKSAIGLRICTQHSYDWSCATCC